jgi:hypothetical protein
MSWDGVEIVYNMNIYPPISLIKGKLLRFLNFMNLKGKYELISDKQSIKKKKKKISTQRFKVLKCWICYRAKIISLFLQIFWCWSFLNLQIETYVQIV